MSINIDFENDFNNEILNEINKIYNPVENDKEIIIDINKLDFFNNEIKIFKNLGIIRYDTNELNKIKYDIFRKYIKREPIHLIEASDIRKLITILKEKDINYKDLLLKFNILGFNHLKIDDDYLFVGNNELQIRAYIMFFGKSLYDKLRNSNITNRININNYKVSNGYLIVNNGEKKIKLANLEEIIIDRIRYNENTYISDFTNNSQNPIAVIKKLRKKLKNNGIINFKISTKRDKFSGDTRIILNIKKDT
ncbi:MAG: hypothetical protein WC850_01875 [Candidatus Gracilibacteria bacterium]